MTIELTDEETVYLEALLRSEIQHDQDEIESLVEYQDYEEEVLAGLRRDIINASTILKKL